jgi:hypothetical protein
MSNCAVQSDKYAYKNILLQLFVDKWNIALRKDTGVSSETPVATLGNRHDPLHRPVETFYRQIPNRTVFQLEGVYMITCGIPAPAQKC